MADMNKRHHKMIQDAIVEGVTALAECPAIRRQLKEDGDIVIVQRWVAKEVAEKMAAKLRYTHDNFEPQTFVREIQGKFGGR